MEENFVLQGLVADRIAVCEKKIEAFLQIQEAIAHDGVLMERPSTRKKRRTKNDPGANVQGYLKQILQVDVTQIFGISNGTALEIFSETGADLSKWESEKHFVSWLNLCPNNKITGGKLISSTVIKKKQAMPHKLLEPRLIRFKEATIGWVIILEG